MINYNIVAHIPRQALFYGQGLWIKYKNLALSAYNCAIYKIQIKKTLIGNVYPNTESSVW